MHGKPVPKHTDLAACGAFKDGGAGFVLQAEVDS